MLRGKLFAFNAVGRVGREPMCWTTLHVVTFALLLRSPCHAVYATQVLQYQNQCKKLPKALRDWQAYVDCRDTIDNFLEALPLFQALAAKAMRERHWRLVMATTGAWVGPLGWRAHLCLAVACCTPDEQWHPHSLGLQVHVEKPCESTCCMCTHAFIRVFAHRQRTEPGRGCIQASASA
jgi:hypothetical protein